jgi:hypothetical protein
MYLWYYILRPMGSPETAQLCLTAEQIVQVRRRLLQLRRDHPLLIVDTYWDEKGRAVCPAALGLGYHIGPEGSIEPCPPLSVAVETIQTGEDPLGTILGSQFLRDFAQFVNQRTRGCVILEYPRELAEFLRNAKARDYSGGKLFSCLENILNSPAIISQELKSPKTPGSIGCLSVTFSSVWEDMDKASIESSVKQFAGGLIQRALRSFSPSASPKPRCSYNVPRRPRRFRHESSVKSPIGWWYLGNSAG